MRVLPGVLLCLALQAQSPDFQRDVVRAHNDVRKKVNVPELTWSDALAATAKDWAQHLLAAGKFEHRPNNKYGENLFEIRGAPATPAEVVEDWASEAKDYNAADNTCRAGAVCGHYTQLVWRSTKRVGCAVAKGKGKEVWVCNYDPPGNYIGQRPY